MLLKFFVIVLLMMIFDELGVNGWLVMSFMCGCSVRLVGDMLWIMMFDGLLVDVFMSEISIMVFFDMSGWLLGLSVMVGCILSVLVC